MASLETPTALGYRWPAEWEPHAATWLAWPHKQDSWPGRFEPIPQAWAELARIIAQHEPVHILAGGAELQADAMAHIGPLDHKTRHAVTLHDVPTDDAWIRDHGPMFLVGPDGLPPGLVDWRYNAWGEKYPPYDQDDRVPEQVARLTGCRRFEPGIVLEGGAVDTDGQGTLLTTESCLLNPNRNPQCSRADMEQYLADYCGARKVLWLGRGIVGDDTDGHIDGLARFVAPATVVAARPGDEQDENTDPLRDNLRRLNSMTDATGRRLRVIELPMPRAIYVEDVRLPASYLNFYLANGLLVVPQFDDPADQEAADTLAKLFPDRQVRGLPARDLIWGLGAVHCITTQQPAAAATKR